MGDPAGIGPEVLIKSFKRAKETQNLVAISDFSKIRKIAEKYDVKLRKINHINDADNFFDLVRPTSTADKYRVSHDQPSKGTFSKNDSSNFVFVFLLISFMIIQLYY